MNGLSDITVIILTYNEEQHIKRAINSLEALHPEIFIVDSFSNDRTLEIAREMGVTVLQHEFVNQAKQFQWALDNCAINTEWVLRMDADEYLTAALAEEIADKIPFLSSDITGIKLRLRYVVFGKWMKYGGRYPLLQMRLWRHGKARMEQRWMDEHMVLTEGQAISFKYDFADHNLHDVGWWTDKHNKYATREAIEVLNHKYHLFDIDNHMIDSGDKSQTGIKRFIKERIYNKMPAFSGPVFYFLYRYIIRLGFLDGKEGFAYHFLQGFWYRVLVEVKVMEMGRELKKCKDQKKRLAKLEELTGFKLSSTIK
ncbi:MAG: glycosyltransferase family 2 protein [Hyphomicrobiaceae bacterium]|nr:glycosyltransferase family 2 protein [Hyphomicrobiaceae bacterium]